MVSLLVGGALATGGLFERLWSYNRENYMWDKQNLQNSVFQVQNIALGRFGLFREDVRDLAGLTTNRMDSYLVVNTLKLGFIVSIFFNFDRTATDAVPSRPIIEELWELMFTVCFLTSFLFLLVSVWFSMHASVVANSFMTKMLVQTVRIPLPSMGEIHAAAPVARDFEGELRTAFRVPQLHSGAPSLGRPGSQERNHVELRGRAKAPAEPAVALQDSASVCSAEGGAAGAQMQRRSSLAAAAAAAATVGAALHGGPVAVAASAASAAVAAVNTSPPPTQSAASCVQAEEDSGDQPASLPHLKLYKELMMNWQPFDLYSKICMSIGTSTMLTGLAYFALYYARRHDREAGSHESPHGGGWLSFIFMAVLAWWSITLDLVLTKCEHILLATSALLGPFLWSCGIIFGGEVTILVPLSFFAQMCWVWLLLAASIGNVPKRWRALLFLDVLPRVSGVDRVSLSDPVARRATLRLMQYLRLVLKHGNGMDKSLNLAVTEVAAVQKELDDLREAAASARLLNTALEAELASWDVGFWVLVAGHPPRTVWVGPSGGAGGRGCVDEVTTLGELLEAARRSTALLRERSQSIPSWTAEDRDSLVGYGGRAWSSVWDFESQFHARSTNCERKIGRTARRFFRAAAAFVALAWLGTAIFATISSFGARLTNMSANGLVPNMQFLYFDALSDDNVARTVDRRALQMPRAWFMPQSFSCNTDATQIAITDGIRAFTRANDSVWSSPLSVCLDDDVRAAVFNADGDVVLTDSNGVGIFSSCSSPRRNSKAPLDAVALDTQSAAAGTRGLVVQDGRLLALELIQSRGGLETSWTVAGAVRPPPGIGSHRWAAVALRAGRALLLNQIGEVFELDVSTGMWSGPWRLPKPSQAESKWRGICALPGGTNWLTLSVADNGVAELWEFAPRTSALSPRSHTVNAFS
eukprot:TRINITY_DN56927_c0_g1_i1.p1 TRINITY_DN56927_c0_g1~~TRINITY_DN56927_c0_g1_i1.p1  ORF type:complete len:947 (+),score=115.34 TRINITY_DN56927_c0_g1_i1:62-2842(+)